MGLPEDVIDLIRIWLNNRMFYVDVKGNVPSLKTRNQVQYKVQD